jgi:hypothetical protein
MLCILPGLEDSNLENNKKIRHILSETERIVGTSVFYAEIWKCLLRAPRCRLSAIKYLNEHIPKELDNFDGEKNVHLTRFTIKVQNRQVILEEDPKLIAQEKLMRKQFDK